MAQRDLTTGSLFVHLRAMVGPAALGMLFTTLYNIVDTYFAGWISTDAQAGLSISFSVFMILMAFGFGLSQGASALIGAALGAKDQQRARSYGAQALALAAGMGVSLGILGIFIAEPALRLMGSSEPVLQAAESYLRLLFLGLPGFLIGFTANGILTAQGDTGSNRTAQIAAFGANVCLNPLLIYGAFGVPGFGFDGIALSTVLIQIGVAVWLVRRALGTDALSGASVSDARPSPLVVKRLVQQGMPASFTMIVMMSGMVIIQVHLQPFGSAAVAGYGIAFRVEQLILLPILSISFSLMPMIAQNYGAGDHDRVRQAVTLAAVVAFTIALIGAVALQFGGRLVTGLFSDDSAAVDAGADYLRIAAMMMPAYTIMFVITALFQGLQRPVWSVVIGVYRQIIALALLPPIFVQFLGFGVTGVWLGLFCAVWSGLLLALVLAARVCSSTLGHVRPDFAALSARA